MSIEKVNNEAHEAWQRIVQHEMDNVEYWGQADYDHNVRALYDDYRVKRNKVITMQRRQQEKDGINNRLFAVLMIIIMVYILVKSFK